MCVYVVVIVFENFDLLMGKVVDFDLLVIEDKLVYCGCGGYCFEYNWLLVEVLCVMGLEVMLLIVWVLWNCFDDMFIL